MAAWDRPIYLSLYLHGERGATVRFQCSCSCCFGWFQREVLSENRAKGSPWSICCGKGRFYNAIHWALWERCCCGHVAFDRTDSFFEYQYWMTNTSHSHVHLKSDKNNLTPFLYDYRLLLLFVCIKQFPSLHTHQRTEGCDWLKLRPVANRGIWKRRVNPAFWEMGLQHSLARPMLSDHWQVAIARLLGMLPKKSV